MSSQATQPIWYVDSSGVLIEDGLVHKFWWADDDGKMHYAEARAEYLDGIPLVAGPWVEYPLAKEPE